MAGGIYIFISAANSYFDLNIKQINFNVLNRQLKSQIFGQDEIIDEILLFLKIRLYGIDINNNNRPISFIFSGTSGIGKTELSIQLAKYTGYGFFRIDMSEYNSEISVNRLIGSAPGYAGYGDTLPIVKHMIMYPLVTLDMGIHYLL